jgi:hypothetical protein
MCYVLAELLYHTHGKERGLKPKQATYRGISHWWLEDAQGNVFDLSAGQFSKPFPYHLGHGIGFLTKQPSKRCQELMRTCNNIRYKIGKMDWD